MKSFFSCRQKKRCVINIGGISNITILSKANKAPTLGYDTGPGNGLMDYWINKHKGQAFDQNGEWAKAGNIHLGLLNNLLSHNYFKRTHPKSTGKEEFCNNWLENTLKHFSPLKCEDVQATLCELTAISISNEIGKHDVDEVLVCGGGAHNEHLLHRIYFHLDILPTPTSAFNIHPDWVEAVCFAWLAKQTIEKKTSNLPSVTGAKGERILGGIYLP